jgi:hypothetical protein
MTFNVVRVEVGGQHCQTLPVERYLGPEKALRATEEDDPGIDKFLTLNARYHPYNSIIK